MSDEIKKNLDRIAELENLIRDVLRHTERCAAYPSRCEQSDTINEMRKLLIKHMEEAEQ